MKVRVSNKSGKHIAVAFILGAAVIAFGGGKAYAQAHDQRHEKADFKHHQRDERSEYGKWAVRDHQRAEKRAFAQEERHEHRHGTHGYSTYGAYPYPSAHRSAYLSGHDGYRYPSGHAGTGGSYHPGQYHGDGQHGEAGYDPYQHDDHH